jgi:hypothetical protein
MLVSKNCVRTAACALGSFLIFTATWAYGDFIIQPVGVTLESSEPVGNGAVENLINGVALDSTVATGDPVPTAWSTYRNSRWEGGIAVGWTGDFVNTYVNFVFDLGAKYNLTSMHYWNYNAWNDDDPSAVQDYTCRGTKGVSVYGSTTGVNGAFTLISSGNLAQATASASYTGSNYTIDAEGFNAIKLVVNTTFDTSGGATSRAALGAVTFVGNPIPEPNTFILLTIGLTGLLAYARRKQK